METSPGMEKQGAVCTHPDFFLHRVILTPPSCRRRPPPSQQIVIDRRKTGTSSTAAAVDCHDYDDVPEGR